MSVQHSHSGSTSSGTSKCSGGAQAWAGFLCGAFHLASTLSSPFSVCHHCFCHWGLLLETGFHCIAQAALKLATLLRTEITNVFLHTQLQRAASVHKRSDEALEFQFNFVETVQIPMLTTVLRLTQWQGISCLCLRTKAATAILSDIPAD